MKLCVDHWWMLQSSWDGLVYSTDDMLQWYPEYKWNYRFEHLADKPLIWFLYVGHIWAGASAIALWCGMETFLKINAVDKGLWKNCQSISLSVIKQEVSGKDTAVITGNWQPRCINHLKSNVTMDVWLPWAVVHGVTFLNSHCIE